MKNQFKQNHAGVVTKADGNFYEGLAALLGSLHYWYPAMPVLIVDCGMTREQTTRLQKAGYGLLFASGLESYRLAPEKRDMYTVAIYGFFASVECLFPVTVHLDADIVVMEPIDELFDLDRIPGIAAVPDYPPLELGAQIGTGQGVMEEVSSMVPRLKLDSLSFNGGIFAIRSEYYQLRLKPIVERLLCLHDRLWGNDMAVLNLAAFAACPEQPFKSLDGTYNTRPRYRRAPKLPANRIVGYHDDGSPILKGPFGTSRILHYVGPMKPWSADVPQDDSLVAWRFYRDIASTALGL
jgi:lipopolysaccharide biosynthesis glycosyltransferase